MESGTSKTVDFLQRTLFLKTICQFQCGFAKLAVFLRIH